MKKTVLLILTALLISFSPVRADEGMWLLPLIEKLNMKKMSELGFRLSAEDIYSINNSSLKDAVVHFGGGCTAEIISAEGLVLTNHHCGYGTIQRLSTVENDYLKDGFWAMSREEELPAPGLSVTFLESFTDITSKIEKATRKAKTEEEKEKAIKSAIKRITKEATEKNEFTDASVTSMYGGNHYYLVVTKTFKDVRFVGAPPSSIGKFGADTDNWMWPRHTGDFSLFRVYADKNNNPAEYSKDNKPYTPKKHLTISLDGVKKGDPTMIIGYPGRTSRFMTAAEVAEMRDVTNKYLIHIRGIRQDVMMEDMMADPEIRLKYSSKYASSSNFWKKARGMNETFKKLKVEERRAKQEQEFTSWVQQSKKRIKKYGDALEKINKAVKMRAEPMYHLRILMESLANIELTAIAGHYGGVAKLLSEGNIEEAEKAAEKLLPRAKMFFKNYSFSTDRKIAKALIKTYIELSKESQRPDIFKTILEDYDSVDEYVDYIYDNSVFSSMEAIQDALANNQDAIINDPAIKFYQSVFGLVPSLRKQVQKASKIYQEGHKKYIAGLLEMQKDKPMYPDANSTMRLTYGQVLDYSPRDAVLYDYITTLDGVMEKEDSNNWEFVVPEKLKELHKNKDYGRYALENGKMPVAFITNNDITNGNSGSPVLNADGHLIGTAFDGNWEAMSGDVIFEPELQRCINVDIRYTLFIIEKFGGAKHIIDELTIK